METGHSEENKALNTSGIGGHPKGLTTLFLTEFWERFSYYGMRAILILYMVAPAEEGGLGYDVAKASGIYGTYTMAVYLTALPGGWIADRYLGARLTVLIGGIIIALGHFSMAVPSWLSFYTGMLYRHGNDYGGYRSAQTECYHYGGRALSAG